MATDAAELAFDQSVEADGSRALWRRTLIALRWVAIAGQTVAVLVAAFWLNVNPPVAACIALIGVAAAFNLAATLLQGDRGRLSEKEAFLSLLFDLCQLVALLYITGGLTNPFALMMLAPVTISAVALSPKITFALGAAAIVSASALAVWHIPLAPNADVSFAPPPLWMAGFWVAIVLGVAFQALYARQVSSEALKMSAALNATQMALEREQRLAAIGSLAAAAAHELGTPLATIKLTASELRRELAARSDTPAELVEDATLISEQATRCRSILERLSALRAPDDEQLRTAPLATVLEEAAGPHLGRHAEVTIRVDGFDAESGPLDGSVRPGAFEVLRRPEIIHGLRNLIENAVDYADASVWIDAETRADVVAVTIADDGPGFAPDILSLLGEPFTTTRGRTPKSVDDRHGLGLGVFISKTLLERSGARIDFYNRQPARERARTARPKRGGAAVRVTWPRRAIEAPRRRVAEATEADARAAASRDAFSQEKTSV